MDITLDKINKVIGSYFTSEDEEPFLCNVTIVYMALKILEYDVEKMLEEYNNMLPEDFKDILAQIHYNTVSLQNMLK